VLGAVEVDVRAVAEGGHRAFSHRASFYLARSLSGPVCNTTCRTVDRQVSYKPDHGLESR
jgi:hypothetical protein